MATRDILEDIIVDFSPDKFVRFFREKNRSFAPRKEALAHYDDENFKDGINLGEIRFAQDEKMLICAFQASQPLSERSGKKAQYEKGKKILKDNQSDAGIFIFYDQHGNFRFSLIYANYLGQRRDWSIFRRFTYFVGNDLTNKTFKQRIGDGDFSSLEKIKDAFSVEKVTKEFYEDIANWYFWAVTHSTFPKDVEAEKDGRNIAVIRLITRMIFIWFMREQGLVPKNLFDEKSISEMLEEVSPESSTYYHAILQNLFFATLSTKKVDRKFRSEIRGYKGYNPDFGNQNVFRFQELFKHPDKLQDYFGEIPFLNGGLFECLDDKPNGIYVDGFTAVKKNQPNVPNILFFSKEKTTNLNASYNTAGKTYKVRGLLEILSSFNFTIDENSPDDQDIALDPELLGRVFENLLASFNPETSTTARKATGSYYTPREIVDYMVSESLKAYFKTHLSVIEDLDNKIDKLFLTGSEENPFAKSESKEIVELIESVKIVDPAVGSGAFPMGALNKLVFILNKVDPGNELWKQAQISAADTIPDPRIKQDTKNRIEEFFKGKNADYGRKLYLIQKCIYGVDIQQIAVEIAKLRFFISLLVNEKIDKSKDNWGIEPLPNLDFKIMQGNSLLEEYEGVKLFDEKLIASIDFDKQELTESIKQKQSELQKEYFDLHAKNQLTKFKQAELNEELKKLDKQLKGLNKQDNKTEENSGLFDAHNEAKQKREMLKRLHIEFFETNEKEIKGKIKKQIEKMEWDLIEATLKEQDKTSELKKLEQFKKSNTKPFFLWKLHFADVFEKGGFDIVIANPPYVSFGLRGVSKMTTEDKNNIKKIFPESAEYKISLYALFMDKAIRLSRDNGVQTFIVPDSFLLGRYFSKIRKLILRNNEIESILLLPYGVFEATVGFSVIYCFQRKTSIDNKHLVSARIAGKNEQISRDDYTHFNYPQSYFDSTKYNRFRLFFDKETKALIKKIDAGSRELGETYTGRTGVRSKIGQKNIISKEKKKGTYQKGIVSGGQILRFKIEYEGDWINIDSQLLNSGGWDYKIIHNPKILIRQTGDSLIASIDKNGYYHLNNVHSFAPKAESDLDLCYVLGILNSRLMNYYYQKTTLEVGRPMAQTDIETIESLPIKCVTSEVQKPFIEIVDKILAIIKSSDYSENPAKKEEVKSHEKQIDQMVYKLYDLTLEEIAIVEGKG